MRAHRKLCCGLSVLSKHFHLGMKWLGMTKGCRRLGQSGSCGQNQYRMDWTGLYWTEKHRDHYIYNITYQECNPSVISRFSMIKYTKTSTIGQLFFQTCPRHFLSCSAKYSQCIFVILFLILQTFTGNIICKQCKSCSFESLSRVTPARSKVSSGHKR